MTDDHISPRALPGQEGGIHTVTGLEHTEAGRPKDTPEVHIQMTEKRHAKLASAVRHPDLTTAKRFGDEGKVDVGILAWGSTFGEALEAMIEARSEGIRCAAMKVVMLSPLPIDAIRSFCEDCREILVPELNYQGQFANLVTAATARSMHRLDRVSGRPMHVEDIVAEIRRLGSSKRQVAA
jgi:2-oxoglutarate ferredoxin oxidoreductase subunit alpha